MWPFLLVLANICWGGALVVFYLVIAFREEKDILFIVLKFVVYHHIALGNVGTIVINHDTSSDACGVTLVVDARDIVVGHAAVSCAANHDTMTKSTAVWVCVSDLVVRDSGAVDTGIDRGSKAAV